MVHDPKEHFSDEQLDVITAIFHGEINKLLIKVVGANLVILFMGIMAIGAGWYRLGHLETQVAGVVKSMSEGPRFTQDEGDALSARLDQEIADLQRQIDSTTARLERIENKIDIIIEKI